MGKTLSTIMYVNNYTELQKLVEITGNISLAKRLLELGITSEALLKKEDDTLIEVGKRYKREVTQKDADLYSNLVNFLDLDRSKQVQCQRYGKEDCADLSTYLVNNYNISKKENC